MGGTVTPLMYVSGEDATAEGLELVDAVTGNVIDDASNCIVIIDGQHRFAAFKKLSDKGKLAAENVQMQKCDCPKGIMATLKAMNGDATPWNGSDVMGACHLTHPDNELLALAADLAGKGYPVSTVGLILSWKGGMKKDNFFNALTNGGNLNVNDCNLERANKFLAVARSKFEDGFIKSKYLINAVISLTADNGADEAIELINELTPQEVNRIVELKRGTDKEGIIFDILKSHRAAQKQSEMNYPATFWQLGFLFRGMGVEKVLARGMG